MAQNRPISAVVVLRPPGGRSLEGVAITSQNVAEFVADQGDRALVASYLASRGFTVEAPGPLDFSIIAPPELFEAVFGADLGIESTSTGVTVSTTGGGKELPLDRLPAEVRSRIEAVAFPRAPDFGPGAP